MLEKSQTITWREYENFAENEVFPEGDIKNFLELLGIKVSELRILTSHSTIRIEIPYNEGLLSLDENTYSGIVDYELEMEHTSIQNAQESLEEVCKLAKVPYVINTNSKQARAMNALKK